MDIVADTNVFLAIVLNEPEKALIIRLTTGMSVISPEILPYEIGNALSAMAKRRRLTQQEALRAEELSKAIAVRLVRVDVRAALSLATAHGIYAYDAYFLHCAKVLSCPLLTLDQGMRHIASQLDIPLLPGEPS